MSGIAFTVGNVILHARAGVDLQFSGLLGNWEE